LALHKYGDGRPSPIVDLMKSEVFMLAAYLKVPDSILNAAPSTDCLATKKQMKAQFALFDEEIEGP
jgi:NAD+ synthase